MLKIRKVKTKSGAIAFQVVQYKGHKVKIEKHIGSAKNEEQCKALQSFRMSKFDLQAQPIYHRNEDAVRSHVLICFVALMAEKYLELKTNISLKKIRMNVWDITESHIQDSTTKEVFKFLSPTSEIFNTPLANLINEWGLLPH